MKRAEWLYSEEPVFGHPYGSYICSNCNTQVGCRTPYCSGCGSCMSDYIQFKQLFDSIGLNYEITDEDTICLGGIAVEGSTFIEIKFHDGKFMEFQTHTETED